MPTAPRGVACGSNAGQVARGGDCGYAIARKQPPRAGEGGGQHGAMASEGGGVALRDALKRRCGDGVVMVW